MVHFIKLDCFIFVVFTGLPSPQQPVKFTRIQKPVNTEYRIQNTEYSEIQKNTETQQPVKFRRKEETRSEQLKETLTPRWEQERRSRST